MSAPEYQWRTPWLYADVDAAKVVRELDALQDNGNAIDPSAVVDWARNHKRSALHKCIEWDDKTAAAKWRIDQVRGVIASIRVKEIHGGEVVITRRFFNVKSAGGYVSRDTITSSADYSASVLEQAKKDLEYWRERYAEIRDIHGVAFESVDQAVRALNEPAVSNALASSGLA